MFWFQVGLNWFPQFFGKRKVMGVIFSEGYEGNFALVFEFVNEPTYGKEISVLNGVLLNEEEPSFLEELFLVFGLGFELGDQHVIL